MIATNRFEWIDNIRATSCLMVILLHVSAKYLNQYSMISDTAWLMGNVTDSLMRASVPLFFMISGFLFFSDKYAKRKNFVKLGAALIFYSIVASIYQYNVYDRDALKLLVNIYRRPAFYHLWFFYPLLVAYFFSRIIRARKLNLNEVLVCYFIFFIILNPDLKLISNILNIDFKISLSSIDGNILYYSLYGVFGALFGNISINEIQNKRTLFAFIYFLSSALIAFLTYTETKNTGKFFSEFYKYTSILVALSSASFFLFWKSVDHLNSHIKIFLNYVAKRSLCVYGIHALIIEEINRLGLRYLNYGFIEIITIFLLTMTLSLGAANIILFFDKKRLVS